MRYLLLGGLCFKEYFLFPRASAKFTADICGLLWFSWVLIILSPLRIFSIISGVLLLVLAIQKWRMPLHFDIGDKTKYQILEKKMTALLCTVIVFRKVYLAKHSM